MVKKVRMKTENQFLNILTGTLDSSYVIYVSNHIIKVRKGMFGNVKNDKLFFYDNDKLVKIINVDEIIGLEKAYGEYDEI